MRLSIRRPLTAYVTDLEGSTKFWERYINSSEALYRDEKGRVQLRDGYNFVHGGDTFDHAPGDLAIAMDLVDLKARFPDRVALLVGNRDLNKLRLASEIDAYGGAKNPETVPLPFFQTPDSTTYAKFLSEKNYSHSRLSYLRYMLRHTMGCSKSFEYRREYLLKSKGNDGEVTDDDVFRSFYESIQPGGAVLEYIRHAQIAAAFDGAVFVHGSVNAVNAGFIPEPLSESRRDTVPPGRRVSSVEEWIRELNDYKRFALDRHFAAPHFSAPHVRGASSLIAAAHTGATRNCMPIVSPFARDHGAHYIDAAAVEFLNRSGYSAVLVGHQPVGDLPLTVSQPGLTLIAADLSYCGGPSTEDNRGMAVADVIVDGDGGRIKIRGRRTDSSEYSFDIGMGGDDFVGRRTTDGWWVRGELPEGNILLHRTRDRFLTNEYSKVSRSSVTLEKAVGAVDDVITPGFTRAQLRPHKVCVKK